MSKFTWICVCNFFCTYIIKLCGDIIIQWKYKAIFYYDHACVCMCSQTLISALYISSCSKTAPFTRSVPHCMNIFFCLNHSTCTRTDIFLLSVADTSTLYCPRTRQWPNTTRHCLLKLSGRCRRCSSGAIRTTAASLSM